MNECVVPVVEGSWIWILDFDFDFDFDFRVVKLKG